MDGFDSSEHPLGRGEKAEEGVSGISRNNQILDITFREGSVNANFNLNG